MKKIITALLFILSINAFAIDDILDKDNMHNLIDGVNSTRAGSDRIYFIPGPIGINLGMLRDRRRYSDNVSACSLCMSCSNVCPAKVDLGEQIYLWRQQLDALGKADSMKKFLSKGMKTVMSGPALFRMALWAAPAINRMPKILIYNGLNKWGKERQMPVFAPQSFNSRWKKGLIR